MREWSIALPYPPNTLSQNARVHFRAKAKATKKYRRDCSVLIKSMINAGADFSQMIKATEIEMRLHFFNKTNRKRDDDNLIGMFKAGRDGLAQGLGFDDVKFRIKDVMQEKSDTGNPFMVVFLRVAEDG